MISYYPLQTAPQAHSGTLIEFSDTFIFIANSKSIVILIQKIDLIQPYDCINSATYMKIDLH